VPKGGARVVGGMRGCWSGMFGHSWGSEKYAWAGVSGGFRQYDINVPWFHAHLM